MRRVLAVLAAAAAAACTGSTMPSPASMVLAATLPPVITPHVLNCEFCPDPSIARETAEFSVTISDGTAQGGVVESVEAVIRNMTRSTEVGRNRIPNATTAIANSSVPRSGSLAVTMGLTFDAPPPRDDVQMTVTVTLTDGRTATAVARVAPGTS